MNTLSCLELSRKLKFPLSTISANVKILEEAGIISTQLLPAKNGSKKLCTLVYAEVLMRLTRGFVIPADTSRYEIHVPIGYYMDFEVSPTCGIVKDEIRQSDIDNPNYFLNPERIHAQLIWFRKGFLEYKVPIDFWLSLNAKSITFELEICSEAPGFNNLLKSDITMWINGVEVGTFESSGDLGGRRGKFTPEFWDLGSTQYGILTKWTVDKHTSINNETVSMVGINDLKLDKATYVTMRIGVKDDAKNVGGINIFGDKFGDYSQGIKMVVEYQKETCKDFK